MSTEIGRAVRNTAVRVGWRIRSKITKTIWYKDRAIYIYDINVRPIELEYLIRLYSHGIVPGSFIQRWRRTKYFLRRVPKNYTGTYNEWLRLSQKELYALAAFWADKLFDAPMKAEAELKLFHFPYLSKEEIEAIKLRVGKAVMSQAKYEEDITIIPPTDYDKEMGR